MLTLQKMWKDRIRTVHNVPKDAFPIKLSSSNTRLGAFAKLAELTGIEPATFPVTGEYAILVHLNSKFLLLPVALHTCY